MTFIDFFGARYLLKSAVIVASGTLFAGMATVINGLLSGIAVGMPAWVGSGLYMLPTNTGVCLSAVMTAYIARWGYDYARTRMMMVGNG